jgi:hypothetical protein
MNEIMIHVQFVDEQTGKAFAETNAPLSSLPQSFEAATQIELRGQPWEVIKADPVIAEHFARSRNLTLILRQVKITSVKTEDILYSLPTICDAIPPIAKGTSKLDRHVFEFHEDYWRQIELISIDQMANIQAELIDIRKIYEESAVGGMVFTHCIFGSVLALRSVSHYLCCVRLLLAHNLMTGLRISA